MARSPAGTDTGTADRELVFTRTFDAPRELVFRAWTEAERLVQWWGPRGFTVSSCEMDVRPGGRYRICMLSPSGTEHPVKGSYLEVVPPERLVFTWTREDDTDGEVGHDTVVTLRFLERDGRTVMHFHHGVFETVANCRGHEGGWSSCLDRLAEFVAGEQQPS
jgi:uncharacterized protein YndB with AHSA1/START domain